MSSHRFDPGGCAVAGCYGPRLPGRTVCSLHLYDEASQKIQIEADRKEAARRFRERRASGEYGALFDDALRAILEDAGDELTTTDELGAVRYALAKLLAEEDDPRQLSMGVARLVGAAANLARTRVATGEHEEIRRLLRQDVNLPDAIEVHPPAEPLPGDAPAALPAPSEPAA